MTVFDLNDDDLRALSLAEGHGVAVLRIPQVAERPGVVVPAICWQAPDETSSVVLHDDGTVTVHTLDRLDAKAILDLAGGLVAVAARLAREVSPQIPRPADRTTITAFGQSQDD
ncbi:hypothetical protein [Prescottella equi]|uniref:hypothetical protein n=1 Tax=Rhodococcus hoagii TaxID=43767 RepID=UPI0007CD86B6|nr:hypothetical protein [Prescottella equi]